MTPPVLSCPSRLQSVWRSAAVDEAISSLRHELRNKLASIRNSTFYIRRRAEKTTTLLADDPRVGEFFQLVDSQLDLCTELLSARTLKTSSSQPEPSAVKVGEVLEGLKESLELPSGVEVSLGAMPSISTLAKPQELELALFSLVENAVEAIHEAGGGQVKLSVREEPQGFWLDVGSACTAQETQSWLRPFFSSKPDRLGVGLKIAKRLATGWGGKLELVAEAGMLRASLWLPAPANQGAGP